jgi:hypothetical protein
MKKLLSGMILAAILLAMASAGARAQSLGAIDQAQAAKHKHVILVNNTRGSVPVYISFASDSVINASQLSSFCTKFPPETNLKCRLTMAPGSLEIPNPQFKYLNLAVTFNGQVGCGTTKGELTANFPSWYDTMDVSEVDGFNNKVEIDAISSSGGTQKIGPANGITGNRLLFGVYPYKCSICVDLGTPPSCPDTPPPGKKSECKDGTENNPTPPCQYQMNDPDGTIKVILVP